MHFLQFYVEHSKKSKSVKVIYIYASERSRYTLSENGILCYAMYDLLFWEYEGLKLKNFVKFLLSLHLFKYFDG